MRVLMPARGYSKLPGWSTSHSARSGDFPAARQKWRRIGRLSRPRTISAQRDQLIALASHYKLLASYSVRNFVAAGGLMPRLPLGGCGCARVIASSRENRALNIVYQRQIRNRTRVLAHTG